MSPRSSEEAHGLVVSDLHLLARRSLGFQLFEELRPQLESASLLVLNGDTFDFRWSTLPNHEASVCAATQWLELLCARHPHCQVHFIDGNHDCLEPFAAQLNHLAAGLPNFHSHPHSLSIGPLLFLHGDCTNRRCDTSDLMRYRRKWSVDRRRNELETHLYRCADRLGMTRLVHQFQFPRTKTVRRLVHHLDCSVGDWRDTVEHCYFGHTHKPFSNFRFFETVFHNTGSAIQGMGFNPVRFTLRRDWEVVSNGFNRPVPPDKTG